MPSVGAGRQILRIFVTRSINTWEETINPAVRVSDLHPEPNEHSNIRDRLGSADFRAVRLSLTVVISYSFREAKPRENNYG